MIPASPILLPSLVMRAKPESQIRYYREFYVANRPRIQARRRLKKALDAEGLSKKEKARLEAELASTYNSDWTPPPDTPPAPKKKKQAAAPSDLPTEPPELLAAPRRKWQLLDGNLYFTSAKGYTAAEILLIQAAAITAMAMQLQHYRPSGRHPHQRLRPHKTSTSHARRKLQPENVRKEQERQAQIARAKGVKPREKDLAIEPRHLDDRTLWLRGTDLVFLSTTRPYTLAEIQELATSLR